MRLTALIVLAGLASHASAAITTFDTDVEGWTKINDVTISHVAAGGNPGGYMRFDDHATGELFSAVAPGAFLGDLSGAIGQGLSFDAQMIFASGSHLADFAKVTLFGAGDSATRDLGAPGPVGQWVNYATTLDAAGWGKSAGAWASLLSDVTAIHIQLEGIYGDEAVGFDNFQIVPEPTSLALIGLGGMALLRRRRAH